MLYDELEADEEQKSEPSVEELLAYLKRLLRKKFRYVVAMGVVALFIVYFVTGGSEAETSVVISEGSELEAVDGTSSEDQQIFVDLSGAVEKPGVYEFSSGSRVVDLIAVGGPVSNDASAAWLSQNLNLSELLVDTQKVYIPFEWELADEVELTVEIAPWQNNGGDTVSNVSKKSAEKSDGNNSGEDVGDSQTPDDGTQKINVNIASQTELESLNGIGKVYSQRIIDNRPYIDVSELKVKANIPESTASKISDFITF